MEITKSQLKQIIKEEVQKILQEFDKQACIEKCKKRWGKLHPGRKECLALCEEGVMLEENLEEEAKSFWTKENAHKGVAEMEDHISNIIGVLQELAVKLDKTNPKIAASDTLRKFKV